MEFRGHHSGPSLNDSSSTILRQYGSPHDHSNLDHSESSKFQVDDRVWYSKLFGKIAPQLPLLWDIPSDAFARQHAQRWKTRNQAAKFSLLLFQEPDSQKELLKNLTQAIETVFGGARIVNAEGIEKEKQWEAFLSSPDLRLAILCDYSLWQMPNLLQFYRELPTRTERFLLNTPLFLLPDLSLYLKDPLLKRSLWKALCQKIGA